MTAVEIKRMFPKFNEFRQICEKLDPHGTFRNGYVDKVIFAPPSQPAQHNKPSSIGSEEQRDRHYDSHPVGPGL